jgi:thiol:disulfide interchange protein
MKRHFVLVACLGLLCFTVGIRGQETKKNIEKKDADTVTSVVDATAPSSLMAVTETKYVPVVTYDPARNADKDIEEALAEAKRTDKRVLLEVGGLWCIWCRHMDDFFAKQRDVLAFREKYFVTLKVNYSEEAKNEAVLSRYPKVAGYPHIFILDAEGTLLHSQDTGDLEQGKGYNLEKFATFLKQWAKAPIETGLKSSL